MTLKTLAEIGFDKRLGYKVWQGGRYVTWFTFDANAEAWRGHGNIYDERVIPEWEMARLIRFLIFKNGASLVVFACACHKCKAEGKVDEAVVELCAKVPGEKVSHGIAPACEQRERELIAAQLADLGR